MEKKCEWLADLANKQWRGSELWAEKSENSRGCRGENMARGSLMTFTYDLPAKRESVCCRPFLLTA